ncbi:unnamed protein product [Phyllotreta striolata]|uniref:Secreted protein n=1 Tax=Phyllotreta striolata TaxID=444603 RepID=A0A9N9TWG1_PHYSR|nr:unnamed protein product [Phyllotreta striolata]
MVKFLLAILLIFFNNKDTATSTNLTMQDRFSDGTSTVFLSFLLRHLLLAKAFYAAQTTETGTSLCCGVPK